MESHQEILTNLQRHMNSDLDDYSFVGDIFSELCSRTNVSNLLARWYMLYQVVLCQPGGMGGSGGCVTMFDLL